MVKASDKFKVTRPDGSVVKEGDYVTDFRGDRWVFESVSRGVEYNGTAKVCVRQVPWRQEFYAQVFNLTVQTLPSESE